MSVMDFLNSTNIDMPPTADMHVHLRSGAMCSLVTPTIRQGGADTVFVMPNLVPPITTVAQAQAYHAQLSSIAPDVTFLMSLYLHPTITPDVVASAAAARTLSGARLIYGIKFYPAGVTTNSDSGVLDITQFYPTFTAMQEHDIVLNLHGELPSSLPGSHMTSTTTSSTPTPSVNITNAEPLFLPTLHALHTRFPRLRIVLEHCTTAAALQAIAKCSPNVAATVTAHHLWLTMDDWAADVHSFCKPVAKSLEDRVALVRALVEPETRSRIFFGSDSAPHDVSSKVAGGRSGGRTAAGCFTQANTTVLVVAALEEAVRLGWVRSEEVTREALVGFLSGNGRRFYALPRVKEPGIKLVRKGERIEEVLEGDGVRVIPFGSGKEVRSVEWT